MTEPHCCVCGDRLTTERVTVRRAVGDCVSWREKAYTIRSFGECTGRFRTSAIEFKEPLHVLDEIGVDRVDLAGQRC